MVLLVLVVALLLPPGLHPAEAQERSPPLEVEVREEDGRARVRLTDILRDQELRDALHSGLPLRVEIVTQLWEDGFFDSQEGRDRWRASLVYDPLELEYLLTVRGQTDVERRYSTLPALREVLPRTLVPALQPPEEGSYYYISRIEVETLSLSDLEELRRWLRGDLAEALGGERDVEGAVERGLRRTVVRLLGMPARRFEARTSTFEFPPRPGAG